MPRSRRGEEPPFGLHLPSAYTGLQGVIIIDPPLPKTSHGDAQCSIKIERS